MNDILLFLLRSRLLPRWPSPLSGLAVSGIREDDVDSKLLVGSCRDSVPLTISFTSCRTPAKLRRADKRREALVSGSSGGVGCGVEWRREVEGVFPIGTELPRSKLISVSFPETSPTATALAIGQQVIGPSITIRWGNLSFWRRCCRRVWRYRKGRASMSMKYTVVRTQTAIRLPTSVPLNALR